MPNLSPIKTTANRSSAQNLFIFYHLTCQYNYPYNAHKKFFLKVSYFYFTILLPLPHISSKKLLQTLPVLPSSIPQSFLTSLLVDTPLSIVPASILPHT